MRLKRHPKPLPHHSPVYNVSRSPKVWIEVLGKWSIRTWGNGPSPTPPAPGNVWEHYTSRSIWDIPKTYSGMMWVHSTITWQHIHRIRHRSTLLSGLFTVAYMVINEERLYRYIVKYFRTWFPPNSMPQTQGFGLSITKSRLYGSRFSPNLIQHIHV